MNERNYELLTEKESIRLQNLFDKMVVKRSEELLSRKDLNEYLDSNEISERKRVDYIADSLWEGINLFEE